MSAATEFLVDRKTLQKKLIEAELVPGEDGLYSTKQVMDALTGDMKAQRLRLVKALAENSELKNKKHKGESLDAREVSEALSAVFYAMRSEILGTVGMPEHLSRSLLTRLSSIDPAKLAISSSTQ
jgi:phage terminase Nu1 subunit (DNA packaging protein)